MFVPVFRCVSFAALALLLGSAQQQPAQAVPLTSASVAPISHATERRTVAGHAMTAEVVRVRLADVRMRVGLAGERVGATESLTAIAKRHGALAAINGSFFAAYADSAVKAPDQTVVTGGRFVHMGNVGSTIGFDADGNAHIGQPRWAIRGTRDGGNAWPDSWFAYWLNRPASSATVTIFDEYWTGAATPRGGTSVVVEGGRVTDIHSGSAPIPDDGYAVYFRGAEPGLLSTFAVGQRIEYGVVPKGGADPFWRNVREAVGAGPLLVDGAEVVLDAAAEGFRDPKILTQSAARSAVGVTPDGVLLLVATSGTLKQVAALMQELGAMQAMNLDGGASSGLWLGGSYLRQPGRKISNALLVLPK